MSNVHFLRNPTASLVELRDLTLGYGARAILQDVSLTVPRGNVTALMGASGGGKTTVLRLDRRPVARAGRLAHV